MKVRFLAFAVPLTLALVLSGCKTTSPLAMSEARTILEHDTFAGSETVQTVTFLSGGVESKPLAIDQFLYAKHWSMCANDQGALQTAATCVLSSEGEAYGHTNGWSVALTPTPSCAKCATWTIPLAKASLKAVDTIEVRSKTTAAVTYTYDVMPNEFGASLAEWQRSHALAWCGDDASAVGGWGKDRTNVAPFKRVGGVWTIDGATPNATFAETFASEATAAQSRACPAS
jgi:hypothetical protein